MRDPKSRTARRPEADADTAPTRFVQLIEFQTSRIDEAVAVLRRLHDAARADGAQLNAEIRKDRDRHDRCVWVLSLADGPGSVDTKAALFKQLTAELDPFIDGHVVVRNLDLVDDDSGAFDDSVTVRASHAR